MLTSPHKSVVSQRVAIFSLCFVVPLTCLSVAARGGSLAFLSSNGQAILKSDLDGSNLTTLSSFAGSFAGGVEYDVASDQVYYTWNAGITQRRVYRVDPDGSNLAIAATDIVNLEAVAVNTTVDKLAWVRRNGTASNLFIRNVSGGGGVFLFNESSSSVTIQDIEIDPINEKIYWVQKELFLTNGSRIRRINFDGTGIQDVVTGLAQPQGLALDIVNDRVYWTDINDVAVRRANLNGSGITDIFVDTSLVSLQDIDLDAQNGKLYFISGGVGPIHRINIDGSGFETLPVTTGGYLTIIIPEPASLSLLLVGLIGLVLSRRLTRRSRK